MYACEVMVHVSPLLLLNSATFNLTVPLEYLTCQQLRGIPLEYSQNLQDSETIVAFFRLSLPIEL